MASKVFTNSIVHSWAKLFRRKFIRDEKNYCVEKIQELDMLLHQFLWHSNVVTNYPMNSLPNIEKCKTRISSRRVSNTIYFNDNDQTLCIQALTKHFSFFASMALCILRSPVKGLHFNNEGNVTIDDICGYIGKLNSQLHLLKPSPEQVPQRASFKLILILPQEEIPKQAF